MPGADLVMYLNPPGVDLVKVQALPGAGLVTSYNPLTNQEMKSKLYPENTGVVKGAAVNVDVSSY